jgi:DNA-binding response OmpR family regulator
MKPVSEYASTPLTIRSYTEGSALASLRSVLVVDRCEETREVLTTALARRGVRILAARGVQQGQQLARDQRPDLIVLDLETEDSPPEEICSCFTMGAEGRSPPLVVLGTVRRRQGDSFPGEIVGKPYHYGPLIRKIEELLSAHGSGHA